MTRLNAKSVFLCGEITSQNNGNGSIINHQNVKENFSRNKTHLVVTAINWGGVACEDM